ncbi:MAG: outer membrane beta-barrel protein [Gemmataceae bacterium]
MLPFVLLVITLAPRQTQLADGLPVAAPAGTPTAGVLASPDSPVLFPAATYQPQPSEEGSPPEPVKIAAPFLGPPTPTTGAAAAPAAPTVLPERWWLMRELQGTWLGAMLDDNRLYLNGWIEQSYTASTDRSSNYPVIFNDRANEYLLQQDWVRLGRKLVTTGTTEMSWGFQVDTIIGSDYRWTLPRGLWNSQLDNSTGAQNLYGVDMVQQYVNLYIPTLFRGTELRLGRFYSPLNFDSIEGISTPLDSRSYAFENSPFTMCGLAAYVTFNTEWNGVFMLVNGNDVYWGDPSEELRFAGNVKWTQSGGGNIVQLGTSLGRGKFNPAYPTPPQQSTLGLADEPFGRNNFNTFDFLFTHLFSKVFSYNLEIMYGYQYDVPQASLPIADPSGFTDWYSVLHYFFYDVNSRLRLIGRWEDFDDCQGQRTGFAGVYNAVSGGLLYRLNPSMWLRPEVRYDYNFESTPFEGKHGLLTAAIDTIVRW